MIRDLCLAQDIWDNCVAEASEKYPLETGGLFLGNFDSAGHAKVTDMIGPGPEAIHTRDVLQFDHKWQNAEIARRYEASGRRLQFLGEWHTHPDATSGAMSELDKITLHKLAKFQALRAPYPAMAIFFGNKDSWAAVPWRIEEALSILGVWTKVSVTKLDLIVR